jgi:hypothetical protein
MPTSAGHTHSRGMDPPHASHAFVGSVGRCVGFSWWLCCQLRRVQSGGTAVADAGILPAVVFKTPYRREPLMDSEPLSINRVLILTPFVGFLLAMLGYIIVLTGMKGLPLSQIPALATGALTPNEPSTRALAVTHPPGRWAALGRPARSVADRDQRRAPVQFSAQGRATIDSGLVDRSRDRRADLMDMAVSIRWHRGPSSDLPPGAD